jgi:MFS family permease
LGADARRLAAKVGWEYFPVAFIGRLPFAMMVVGVLTLVATLRGSVAEAGLAAAAAGVGTAIAGPATGVLADRTGQRAVLLVLAVLSILASSGLVLLAYAGAPLAAILLVSLVLGASIPQVSPFSRSRLVGVAAAARSEATRWRAGSLVQSYESAMDELSFVIGPVLVGVLTAFIAPWAPLAIGAALTASFVVWFALHPSVAAAVHRAHIDGGARSPWSPYVLLLCGAMLLVGGVFGSILTALTEFLRMRGLEGQTGIVYGAMSVGAIVVAVGAAALPRRFTLPARWAVFAVVGVAGATALALSDSVPLAVVGLFLSGCGVGAMLVVLFSLGAEAAPPGRATTVLTTLQSTLVVGQAAAAATGGLIVQAHGPATGFWITTALIGGLLLLAVVNLVVRRRR